jgi:hypothetical protein
LPACAKKRGRKLSDSGANARFYNEVRESHLGNIIKVNLKDELFSYAIDEGALKLAEMDGKLLVVTNVKDIDPPKIIERNKSLSDIERGFKVLKSELEIGPVYHRLPERIRAHASICFMALILHRVMRMRLRAGNTGITPERALQTLKRIQHHRVPSGFRVAACRQDALCRYSIISEGDIRRLFKSIAKLKLGAFMSRLRDPPSFS